MNEEPPTHPEHAGDDPVEARIVAWVLGEASAFEAAELERLCAEKPELLVFRRRMRELHGLLTEAEAAEPDDSWKLPAEKRKVLDEIFAREDEKATNTLVLDPHREKRISRSGRRAALAIAACVVVTVFVVRLIPTGYEAEAVLEIKPQAMGNIPLGSGSTEQTEKATPQFFGTEFAKIKSYNSLSKVVDKLSLTERWGVDRDTAIKRLKDSIRTENLRGTDLISIRVREKTDAEAREITRAVAESYADYRSEIERSDAEKAMAELNKAVRDQEDKVEERRKVLATIVRTKGIIYKGKDSLYGDTAVDEDKGARVALQTYNQLQQEKMQLESQINSLLKYDGDQLMTYASGLEIPDNILRIAYPDYQDTKLKLQELKNRGLGTEHPTVKALEDQLANKKKPLDEGMVNLRATLQAQLDMANDRLKNVEDLKDNTREDAIKRGLDAQDYVDAKRDFENDEALLQQMRLKQTERTIREKIAGDSVVIHEMPELAANERMRVVEFASKQSSPVPASPLAPPVDSMDQIVRNEPQVQLESATAPVNPGSVMPAGEARSDAKPAELDSVAAATRQQPSKKSAASPAEPAAYPPAGTTGDAVAGNSVGRSMPGQSLRQPRPKVASSVGTDGKKEKFAEDSIEAGIPEMNLALEDSKASGGSGGGKAAEVQSQSHAGIDLYKQLGSDQPAASPEPEFDMVERLKNDKRSEIERRIADIDPAYNPVLGGLEQRGANLALSGEDGTVAAKGDALLNEGRAAYAKGDYQQAVEKYRDALKQEPDEKHRKNYTAHLGDASVALSMQHRKVGKYAEARELLEDVLAKDPANNEAKRELGYLDDPIRSNPALSYQHGENTDELRRSLYTAEGNFNLGKYDEAKREFETALRVDPDNAAARRGLERVETAKTDYYRAAYDHTRAELLSQVDSAWELSLPAEASAPDPGSVPAKRFSSRSDARSDVTEDTGLKGQDNKTLEAKLGQLKREIGNRDLPGEERQAKFRNWEAINLELIRRAELEKEQQHALLAAEVPAAENPYSTFSLNISDASFQMAKAALEKGERPDPASIKPEQFYNAVDYGDPAPSAGEPVAATVEQSVHPIVPGRSLVRVAVRTGAAGRSAAQPLRLTLLVDQSGSMVREDRRAAMERALSQLSGLLTKDDIVNVIGFSRTPRLLADGMKGDQSAKLGALVNQTASEGGTNLEEAMKLGSELAARHQLASAQNRIVLFTDGAANLGDADPARLAEQVKTLRQKGISFDIAGIAADDLNDRLLSELARNGNGRYYVVGEDGKDDSFARQLAGAFRPAAENVKIQVIFNPRRVSSYKLIGFEKDRLKTEDFRNDSVDAAELAAEETGTAIYQVQEIPEGAGEIGELSVRFRDTASGEMVERSWTMPHASSAVAFDRAAPSMQLAGLSLLAAEKLRGGPLADAIDFKQLSETIGTVKQYYGSSSRAGDMLRLIDSIK